ncbi:hypothetical protein [Pseudonocardia humida]|uniref:Uncharacterized protein n=1 Tax=Pseudonocardia humida TaxID=2800819 RepID=A0ABT0ZRY5_9PSEU|nr:hypothetical protein [Pseudonocardia humida]MCO1653482.1 hypothetical protein [Pseudonocardia humida]
MLLDLMDLPGATYSCVAHRVSGALLGEVGTSAVPPGVVMEWGGNAAGFLAAADGDGLDDLMISSHRFYHVVRLVEVESGELLIYLCLDRGRSNLAVARRELGASWLRNRLAVASVGPPPRPPAGPPEERVRRSAPAALPTPRNGSSPAVASLAPRPVDPGRGAVRGRPTGPVAPAAGPPGGIARGAREVSRPGPTHVPLPRRSGPSRVPPPLPTDGVPVVHPITGQAWATDVGTMRRLLGALRALR